MAQLVDKDFVRTSEGFLNASVPLSLGDGQNKQLLSAATQYSHQQYLARFGDFL